MKSFFSGKWLNMQHNFAFKSSLLVSFFYEDIFLQCNVRIISISVGDISENEQPFRTQSTFRLTTLWESFDLMTYTWVPSIFLFYAEEFSHSKLEAGSMIQAIVDVILISALESSAIISRYKFFVIKSMSFFLKWKRWRVRENNLLFFEAELYEKF